MLNLNEKSIAIARLASAIQYITWAMTENDIDKKKEWIREAKWMIKLAIDWLDK